MRQLQVGLLNGKICIITGGAGSIGLETARLFVTEGARVILIDLDEEVLQKAADEFDPEQVSYKVADVSNSSAVKEYYAQIVSHWGNVDVIFSNAGNAGVICPIADYPEDVFDSVYAVHVKGAFLNCKYGIPHMNDGGSIIITSSVAAFRGDAGVYAYITAKHAQIGLMRSVAKEVATRRIRVNSIHPGPIDNTFQMGIEKNLGDVLQTDATKLFNSMIPLGRHALPQEVARSVLYLASDQSSFTTASTLVVDGGMSC